MGDVLTKIHASVGAVTVDVEGTENFVRSLWPELSLLLKLEPSALPSEAKGATKSANVQAVVKTVVKAKNVKSKGAKVQRLKGLDLAGGEGKLPLDEYTNVYRPQMFYEKNLVFASYMAEVSGVAVTPDHLFTCYEELGDKAPTAFLQSLRDTASDRKWIDISDIEDIRLTIAGRNYLKDMQTRSSK